MNQNEIDQIREEFAKELKSVSESYSNLSLSEAEDILAEFSLGDIARGSVSLGKGEIGGKKVAKGEAAAITGKTAGRIAKNTGKAVAKGAGKLAVGTAKAAFGDGGIFKYLDDKSEEVKNSIKDDGFPFMMKAISDAITIDQNGVHIFKDFRKNRKERNRVKQQFQEFKVFHHRQKQFHSKIVRPVISEIEKSLNQAIQLNNRMKNVQTTDISVKLLKIFSHHDGSNKREYGFTKTDRKQTSTQIANIENKNNEIALKRHNNLKNSFLYMNEKEFNERYGKNDLTTAHKVFDAYFKILRIHYINDYLDDVKKFENFEMIYFVQLFVSYIRLLRLFHAYYTLRIRTGFDDIDFQGVKENQFIAHLDKNKQGFSSELQKLIGNSRTQLAKLQNQPEKDLKIYNADDDEGTHDIASDVSQVPDSSVGDETIEDPKDLIREEQLLKELIRLQKDFIHNQNLSKGDIKKDIEESRKIRNELNELIDKQIRRKDLKQRKQGKSKSPINWEFERKNYRKNSKHKFLHVKIKSRHMLVHEKLIEMFFVAINYFINENWKQDGTKNIKKIQNFYERILGQDPDKKQGGSEKWLKFVKNLEKTKGKLDDLNEAYEYLIEIYEYDIDETDKDQLQTNKTKKPDRQEIILKDSEFSINDRNSDTTKKQYWDSTKHPQLHKTNRKEFFYLKNFRGKLPGNLKDVRSLITSQFIELIFAQTFITASHSDQSYEVNKNSGANQSPIVKDFNNAAIEITRNEDLFYSQRDKQIINIYKKYNDSNVFRSILIDFYENRYNLYNADREERLRIYNKNEFSKNEYKILYDRYTKPHKTASGETVSPPSARGERSLSKLIRDIRKQVKKIYNQAKKELHTKSSSDLEKLLFTFHNRERDKQNSSIINLISKTKRVGQEDSAYMTKLLQELERDNSSPKADGEFLFDRVSKFLDDSRYNLHANNVIEIKKGSGTKKKQNFTVDADGNISVENDNDDNTKNVIEDLDRRLYRAIWGREFSEEEHGRRSADDGDGNNNRTDFEREEINRMIFNVIKDQPWEDKDKTINASFEFENLSDFLTEQFIIERGIEKNIDSKDSGQNSHELSVVLKSVNKNQKTLTNLFDIMSKQIIAFDSRVIDNSAAYMRVDLSKKVATYSGDKRGKNEQGGPAERREGDRRKKLNTAGHKARYDALSDEEKLKRDFVRRRTGDNRKNLKNRRKDNQETLNQGRFRDVEDDDTSTSKTDYKFESVRKENNVDVKQNKYFNSNDRKSVYSTNKQVRHQSDDNDSQKEVLHRIFQISFKKLQDYIELIKYENRYFQKSARGANDGFDALGFPFMKRDTKINDNEHEKSVNAGQKDISKAAYSNKIQYKSNGRQNLPFLVRSKDEKYVQNLINQLHVFGNTYTSTNSKLFRGGWLQLLKGYNELTDNGQHPFPEVNKQFEILQKQIETTGYFDPYRKKPEEDASNERPNTSDQNIEQSRIDKRKKQQEDIDKLSSTLHRLIRKIEDGNPSATDTTDYRTNRNKLINLDPNQASSFPELSRLSSKRKRDRKTQTASYQPVYDNPNMVTITEVIENLGNDKNLNKENSDLQEGAPKITWRRNPRTNLNKIVMTCGKDEYKKPRGRKFKYAGKEINDVLCMPKVSKPASQKVKDRKSSIKRWRKIKTNPAKMKRMKVKRSMTKRFSKKVR